MLKALDLVSFSSEEAKANRDMDEEGLDYIFVGHSHEAVMKTGIQVKSDTSHMAFIIMKGQGGWSKVCNEESEKIFPNFTSSPRQCLYIKNRA